ncbi:MAG: hypothetical protein ABW252_25575 [Polyangiales bacterium]
MARARAWVLVSVALGIPCVAHAGNDDEILLGNDAALMGGAVVASVNDGSALWYNPAGLALASGSKVDVGASAFTLRTHDAPSLIRWAGGTDGDANFTELVTVPSALTYLRRFGDRVTGGLGLFTSHFNDGSLQASTSFEDVGVARASVLYAGELARYHLIAGVGVQVAPRVSVGIALSGDYQNETDTVRVTITGEQGGQTFIASTASSFSSINTLGFHLRAGISVQATDQLRLGVSLESPGFYFFRGAHASVEAIQADLTETPPQLAANTESPSRRGAVFGMYAPVRVRFGGALAVGGGTLALEADVQSKVKDELDDPDIVDDEDEIMADRVFTWNVRAGARFPVGEHYHLGAGFFTDRGSERKDKVGAGRMHFYGGTLGVQYENRRMLAPAPGETEPRHGLTFSSTVALRYAYGSGKESGISFDPNEQSGIADRAVQATVHEVTLHLGSGLYF